MADLLALDFHRNPDPRPCPLLAQVQTPLNKEAWKLALASHPDRAFVRYLIGGISEGFRIGFNCSCPL